ncbi:hypothetical protein FSP39_020620 [Pinctada imbricata]|uniref:G-protein coupled receptors family 1 profile domain-containing protein n=1 Tax=Pinctada imbricata TaxID=66713 RepID=A0AA88Y5L8_PINIB|nr:hypothetical protein FSP39_020620 [Pinctada imbricata]
MKMDNQTDQYNLLLEWNTELSVDRIPNSVILILYIIVGIVGNSAVIFVYKSKMKVKQDNRYFILFLAELDLIAVVISASYTLFLNFYMVLPKGGGVCKTFSFISQMTAITSCFVLMYIAIHRYKLVCHPLKKQLSLCWKKVLLGISVVVGAVLSFPVLFFYGEFEVHDASRNVTGYECGVNIATPQIKKLFSLYTIILGISAVGVLVAIGVLYFFILKAMRHRSATFRKREESRRKMRQMFDSPTNEFDSNDALNETTATGLSSSSSSINLHHINITKNALNGNEKHPRASWILMTDDKRPNRSSAVVKTPPTKRKASVAAVKNHFASNRYSYIFLSITIFFIISYVPTLIMVSVSSKEKDFWMNLSYGKLQIFLILRRMFIIDHLVNPFIYGYFDGAFRRQIKKLFCSYCFRITGHAIPSSTVYQTKGGHESSSV